MQVTFLGTGTSRGIPVIGCRCKTCLSSNGLDKRLRASVLLESEASVVIDTSVDFRTQMLRYDVKRMDAVVFTHSHVDHILGLDDVYPFNLWSSKAMPVFGSEYTLSEIRKTFRHLFTEKHYPGIARVELCAIEDDFQIGDLTFQPVEVLHGKLPILGFRIGNFAYITDVSHIPDQSMKRLQGLEYLVLDGLRFRKHPAHFSISEAIEVARTLQPKQTYLIHMSHEVEHEHTSRWLPSGVALSYDGLVLEV